MIPIFLGLLLAGCGNLKTVTTLPNGGIIEQQTNEAALFSQHQGTAWTQYYKAVQSPPVIATITPASGETIKIYSQIAPPTPSFVQHQNQWIRPVSDIMTTAIKVVGGGLVLKEVVGAISGTTINSGGGDVVVDRSDAVNVSTIHAEGGGIEQLEGSQNVDTSLPPTVVTQDKIQVVTQDKIQVVKPEIIRPEVVKPEVVIIPEVTP